MAAAVVVVNTHSHNFYYFRCYDNWKVYTEAQMFISPIKHSKIVHSIVWFVVKCCIKQTTFLYFSLTMLWLYMPFYECAVEPYILNMSTYFKGNTFMSHMRILMHPQTYEKFGWKRVKQWCCLPNTSSIFGKN